MSDVITFQKDDLKDKNKITNLIIIDGCGTAPGYSSFF